MTRRATQWRAVLHPLKLTVSKGWRWGRGCLISRRGTVFETRVTHMGVLARQRREFQLKEN